MAKSNFYPRPPRGGRPAEIGSIREVGAISIHALREEGDTYQIPPQNRRTNFYPRPPRGGRPCRPRTRLLPTEHFYPRPPRGGRHFEEGYKDATSNISIHALREEGDVTL